MNDLFKEEHKEFRSFFGIASCLKKLCHRSLQRILKKNKETVIYQAYCQMNIPLRKAKDKGMKIPQIYQENDWSDDGRRVDFRRDPISHYLHMHTFIICIYYQYPVYIYQYVIYISTYITMIDVCIYIYMQARSRHLTGGGGYERY